jgi:Rps23 Pro-64 3,4-dihydroxylase Tpa1-like proline 4-hydroxylase
MVINMVNVIHNLKYQALEENITLLSPNYQAQEPFPHLILDEVFNPDFLEQVADCYPEPNDEDWWKYQNVLEKKLARNDIHRLALPIQRLIHELQSNRFVKFLEALTGIPALITDHTLNGGGLHQIVRGGKLDVHADYNYHPLTHLDRRVNVIVYLNRNWRPEWKGNLELWDKDMLECKKSVEPIFNRLAVFNVTDQSFHGHPDPLECPEHESRKSIALYYYSNGRPAAEKTPPHSTLFKRRPSDPITNETEALRFARSLRRLSS